MDSEAARCAWREKRQSGANSTESEFKRKQITRRRNHRRLVGNCVSSKVRSKSSRAKSRSRDQSHDQSKIRSSGAGIETRAECKREGACFVLHRARRGFQRLVGNFKGEDLFFP